MTGGGGAVAAAVTLQDLPRNVPTLPNICRRSSLVMCAKPAVGEPAPLNNHRLEIQAKEKRFSYDSFKTKEFCLQYGNLKFHSVSWL